MIFWKLLILVTIVDASFNTSECGLTKNCYSIPANCHQNSNEKCDLIFSTMPFDDENVIVEIFGKKEGNDYLAIGFSEDDKMGNDAVTACLTSPKNGADLYLGFNPGPWHEPLNSFTEKDAKLMASATTDDFIYCQIQQSKKSSKKQLPDFDKSYQILFARGPRSTNNGLDVHTMASVIPELVDVAAMPEFSAFEPEKIDINDSTISTIEPFVLKKVKVANTTDLSISNEKIQSKNEESTIILTTTESKSISKKTGPFFLTGETKVFLVRLHGLFMIIGWIAMIGIGIFSARYLKRAVPNTRVAGINLWFHFHRNLNFFAVILVVLGSILIFIAKDLRWTGPFPDRPAYLGAWHSLVGLISVILAIFQPLLAFFRCTPTDSKRPIFNWIHWSIGIIAIVLAVIATIFATIRFSVWNNRNNAITIIVLYTIISILLIIGLETFNIIRIKNEQKTGTNSFEMRGPSKHFTNDNGSTFPITQQKTKDTLVNFFGYFIFAGISIATVVILILLLF